MADLILKICFQATQTLNDKDRLKLSAVDVVGDREDFMLPDFLRPCDAFDAVPLPLSLPALLWLLCVPKLLISIFRLASPPSHWVHSSSAAQMQQ